MKHFASFALALTLISIGAREMKADLIVNGSFELPNVGGGFGIFPNGVVPGWTSNNNETEIDNSAILGLPNFDGPSQSMELNGNTFDTISQTVTGLTPGQQYTLTWAYGNRPGGGFEQAFVFFGGALVDSDSSLTTAPGTWTPHSLSVTATATSEVLTFQADPTGSSPSVGNEIDGVTLNAVPEPSSLGLFVCGLAGLFCARRRRCARR